MKKPVTLILFMASLTAAMATPTDGTFSYYDAEGEVSYFNTQGTSMMPMIAGIRVQDKELTGHQITGLRIKAWPFGLGMSNYYIWASEQRPGWDDNAYQFTNLEHKEDLPFDEIYTTQDFTATFASPVTIGDTLMNVGIGFKLARYPQEGQKECIPIIANPDREANPYGIPNSFYLGKASGYWGDYSYAGALTMTLILDGKDEITLVPMEEEDAIYYDLQGHQVQEPQKGIFIKRQGSKAEKCLK